MATRFVPSPQPQIVDYGPMEQHFNEVTFTCHLCNEPVQRSTFLSCLHSFCEACIDERLQLEESGSLQCPLCPSHENESSELHTNPLPELINKLKRLKTALMDGTENISCSDCVFGAEGKTAVAYCVECNATICQIDMRSHQKYNLGHLMLQLDTLQESSVKDILHSLQSGLKSTESNYTIQYTRESKYKLPEGHTSPFSERANLPIQDECIREAKSRISQLEDRKSDLEKKWDSQVSQVVSFFQQLHSKLETLQAALLEQLSQMYHTLMTPLQEAIRQLQQTANYTGYVGVLSRYSQVAGVCDSIGDRLMGISMFVANYMAPTDAYSVRVDKQDEQTITKTMNNYLNLTKEAQVVPKPTQGSFQPKRHVSYKLGKEVTNLVNPSDIAFDSNTNTFYALFDTYWRIYQQRPKSLYELETIRISKPDSFPINSSIALLNNSVIIMANHILYVYSEKGEVINQFQIQNQIGLFFNNPKIYTFTGIDSIYLASIESPEVCKVSYRNGTKEKGINLTSQTQAYSYPGNANFADMVRSTTQVTLLFILHTTYPTNNPPQHNTTTNNQYCIQSFDINNMQTIGVYSLSQQMSPFCCITAMNDTLCVLDISTGSVHKYLFSEMAANNESITHSNKSLFTPYGIKKETRILKGYTPNANRISWHQHSLSADSIPKCTEIEGKTLKDMKIRATYCLNSKQLIILSGGKMHFSTLL